MKNINYMCEVNYSDGTTKYKYCATYQAACNYANRQFTKDEDVIVKIYDSNANLMTTYHA